MQKKQISGRIASMILRVPFGAGQPGVQPPICGGRVKVIEVKISTKSPFSAMDWT
jgi:hypothetical protein